MIRIILIRHGRTAWNVGEGPGQRFRGIIDLPLSDEGVAQAEATAHRLADLPLAGVYSSPLQRAAHTAQIIAASHQLAAQPMPGLSSMDYGDWAGQLHTDVARDWPDLYRQWRHDPFSMQIPGGERMADLRDAAVNAVHGILSRHVNGETIALISHQVVTKTLICALMGLPNTAYWLVRQDLCNLNRFDFDPTSGQFSLVGINDVCHLTPGLPRLKKGGTRIILVRHGQTAWNAGAGLERFRGRTDLPLDETGLSQATAVAKRLKQEPISAIYASPLARARQTVVPLAVALDQPIGNEDALLDIDYGRFQGLTHAEAAQVHPELFSRWRTAPGQVHFPGGESLHDVQDRLLVLLDELARQHNGEAVVLVGHQIVNKVLICTLLGLDLDQIWRIGQDTAAINVVQLIDGEWLVLNLNDACHL